MLPAAGTALSTAELSAAETVLSSAETVLSAAEVSSEVTLSIAEAADSVPETEELTSLAVPSPSALACGEVKNMIILITITNIKKPTEIILVQRAKNASIERP